MRLPSVKYLQECFLHERKTGKLFWKKRPLHHFPDVRVQKIWNTRYAGKESFHADPRGYRVGCLEGTTCYAHRVIWKLVRKEEPPLLLDHRDRNKSNNRYRNLRPATSAQNRINSPRAKGVCFDAARGKWLAYTKINRKMHNIGRFDTEAAALTARKKVIRELYGEFAP